MFAADKAEVAASKRQYAFLVPRLVIKVLTRTTFKLCNFFNACLIWSLFARISTTNVNEFARSICFIAASVKTGDLMIACALKSSFAAIEVLYFGAFGKRKVCGRRKTAVVWTLVFFGFDADCAFAAAAAFATSILVMLFCGESKGLLICCGRC